MTTTNDQIKELAKGFEKKNQELQEKRMSVRASLERLEKIKYLPRQVETPEVKSQEVEVDNPQDPDGPKIKTLIPATPASTMEVFDIVPKNFLSGEELTEELRDQVFNSVKQELTNF